MKRIITVIGGGQSGLQLALGLQQFNKYRVTLVTNQTASQVKKGRILSNQVMFSHPLHYERKIKMEFWHQRAPQHTQIQFNLANPEKPDQRMISWSAGSAPYQSVDQRMKFSHWLNKFQMMGGNLIVDEVTPEKLDTLSDHSDLTIVASGKGEISQLFKRDNVRSHFTEPPRTLACGYVKGMMPDQLNRGLHVNIIPGVGEYFTVPGLTISGPCEMILFEGIPNGPLDCWQDVNKPEEFIKKAKYLLDEFVPWEADRCDEIAMTDPLAFLKGRFTPTIRKPTTISGSGKPILGMADVVVLNDPIAGQGANNACVCAGIYLKEIIKHGDKEFDQAWMENAFEKFWHERGKASTKLSNILLLPPQPYIVDLLAAASEIPPLAQTLLKGFAHPNILFPWIADPIKAQEKIEFFKAEHAINQTTYTPFKVCGLS